MTDGQFVNGLLKPLVLAHNISHINIKYIFLTSVLDYDDGKFLGSMEWSMVFVKVPLESMVFQRFFYNWTIDVDGFSMVFYIWTIVSNGFSMVF